MFNMANRKKLKKWGNSLVMVMTKEDIDLYGFVEGDIVDISDMFLEQVKPKKRRELNENTKKI